MKVDFEKMVEFVFKENGFEFRSSRYKEVERVFNIRPSGQLLGIKENGDRCLIDSK